MAQNNQNSSQPTQHHAAQQGQPQQREASRTPQMRTRAGQPASGARRPSAASQPKNATDAAYVAGIAAGAAAVAKKSGKKKTGLIVGIIVAVVACAAIIIGIVVANSSQDDFYDGNSIIGQAPYKTDEEIQAELDRLVEEGMLNISIASVIEFEDGESEGTAYIENVPSNRYTMKVDITLDDTGETLYESGGLKPDNYIEKIRLNRDLDKGTYSATATFHALDPDSLTEIGQAAAKVTLNVLN